jgi:hypothetical protein
MQASEIAGPWWKFSRKFSYDLLSYESRPVIYKLVVMLEAKQTTP